MAAHISRTRDAREVLGHARKMQDRILHAKIYNFCIYHFFITFTATEGMQFEVQSDISCFLREKLWKLKNCS